MFVHECQTRIRQPYPKLTPGADSARFLMLNKILYAGEQEAMMADKDKRKFRVISFEDHIDKERTE
jgi:hypothetical protein